MKQHSDRDSINEMAKKAVEASRDLASRLPKFGHVVWLYTQSPQHKHLFIQDLESRVLPGILADQCKLYLRSGNGDLPLGFVSWAYLSEEAEQRYIATQRIAPADWKSGDHLWLVDMVTPFGGAGDVIMDLSQTVHPGKSVHLFYPNAEGRLGKTTLESVIDRSTSSSRTRSDAESGSQDDAIRH